MAPGMFDTVAINPIEGTPVGIALGDNELFVCAGRMLLSIAVDQLKNKLT